MKRIACILVANRGEIALRIQRTARSMGISTVAVFSDADAEAPFVRAADRAVRIGPPPSAESYLRIDKLIEAARVTGADAVHPGFGFLAENADFAEACVAAGLLFVGPSPSAIRSMGSKREAKRLVAAAGVPVVPGSAGDDQSIAGLERAALKLGFPLLIKASAGGGGKGMRIQRSAEGLTAELESARREALNAFGDDTLLIERYVEAPRHVEIQILGDQHGQLVHLFERECSIQRRHQKIIEETPSTALTPQMREEMGRAAVAAGHAVDYQSAGTVEFILAPNGEFYFLEVNTRLQVEHPITECVTGIDLVREQIRIAEGEPLGYEQSEIRATGAAIECRLYAEDAENEFLPTTGRIVDWHLPEMAGLRVDSGVEAGSEVSVHYDPMLAKIIAHAPSRDQALRKMIRALSLLSVQGVTTNRGFLVRVLSHPEFAAGRTHTHFIEQHLAGRTIEIDPALETGAAIAAALAGFVARRRGRSVLPWLEPGYRNNRASPEHVEYALGERTIRVEYESSDGRQFEFVVDGRRQAIRLILVQGPEVAFETADGVRQALRVIAAGKTWYTHGPNGSLALEELPRFALREQEVPHGSCVAPMPGKVVRIMADVGQSVRAGEVILVLEAMKMEHAVKAPENGVVHELCVAEGNQVEAGSLLAVVGD